MSTVPEACPSLSAADTPLFDPSSSESTTRLIVRLKNNNRALENLVRVLDGGEARPEAGAVDGMLHA